jgi:hypothetical protein
MSKKQSKLDKLAEKHASQVLGYKKQPFPSDEWEWIEDAYKAGFNKRDKGNEKKKESIKFPKSFTNKEIISEFNKLDMEKQNKILTKALKLSIDGRAGTYDYAIATAMGYNYEDNGGYTK